MFEPPPIQTGSTSTATLTLCRPPPVRMPATELTSPVGDSDVFPGGLDIIRRIEINPAGARGKNGEPCVAGIGADEPRHAFRRACAQVTTDIARGQAERAQARDAGMREILAHTT